MDEEKPSVSQSLRNFREYDAPFATKVRLAFANNFQQLRTRKDCCGNPGEPGC